MQKAPRRHNLINLCEVWDGLASAEAAVRREVLRALKKNRRIFDSDAQQQETLRSIQALDSRFEKTGGAFFHAGADAFETASAFANIHIECYRKTGRPSLPALAVHHAVHLGIDKNSPAYKALILVAVRAEKKTAASPEYHSKFHYLDVAAMTANLLAKNDQMASKSVAGVISLTQHERALTFIAALGHDLDHEGRCNPPDDPFFNEKKSFHLMEPLLRTAGLSPQDRDKICTILMTTSPDGPHAVMKAAALAQRTGAAPDFAAADPQNRFAELRGLEHDARLTQMAAIVSDADLYGGSGAGLKTSQINSTLFQEERRKAGDNTDLTSDRARKFFLDNIVGREGYASHAGRAIAGESLDVLRRETERRITLTAKPPAS